MGWEAIATDLPGFVVMTSLGKFGQAQPIAQRMWHSGFLPSRFQGVEFRSKGDAVLYLSNPPGVDRQRQADLVDAVKTLNTQANQTLDDPEIATRVSQYEMAFRMQASVPHLMDVSDEPAHVMEMYGTQGADGSFARTACSPAGWPSAACASSSFTIAIGTTTAASRSTSKERPPRSIAALWP